MLKLLTSGGLFYGVMKYNGVNLSVADEDAQKAVERNATCILFPDNSKVNGLVSFN